MGFCLTGEPLGGSPELFLERCYESEKLSFKAEKWLGKREKCVVAIKSGKVRLTAAAHISRIPASLTPDFSTKWLHRSWDFK